MRLAFIIVISIWIKAGAQVSETNFLGKKWYLHGVDLRLIGRNTQVFSNPVMTQHLNNAWVRALEKEFPTTILRTPQITDAGQISNLGVSTGLVFKPFYKSDYAALRSIVLSHLLGVRKHHYKYLWDDIRNASPNTHSSYHLKYTESMFFYQPSIYTSSPAVLKRVKFYSGIDLRFGTSNQVSIESPEIAKDYIFSNSNTRNSAFYSLAKRELGAGYSVGVKLAATCYFNIHLEWSDNFNTQWFPSTRDNFYHRMSQINFGFRYKFAGPMPANEDEVEQSSNFKTILW